MFELTTPFNVPSRNAFSHTRRGALVAAWQSTIVLALICLSRVIGITRQSLWYDEGYTFNLASSGNFSEFLRTFASYTTSEHLQPVYYFFIFLWSRVAGSSDFALRLPSALFSTASAYAVYDLCLHLPRARRTTFSLLACAAIVFSSFSVYYAQEARPYALLQALSFWLLNVWIRKKVPSTFAGVSRRTDIAFSILCSLCVLASAFTALLVFSLAASDWMMERSVVRRLCGRGAPLASCAVCTAGYLWLGLRIFPGFVAKDVTIIKQPLWMNVGYTIYGILFGTTLGPTNAMLRGSNKLHLLLAFWPVMFASAITVTVLASGVMYILHDQAGMTVATRSIAAATAIYAAVFFAFFGAAGHLNILPRHASALFSLVFVLTLLCAATLESPHRPKPFTWLSLGISTWFAMNLVSLYGYAFDPGFRKDDYRATTEIVRSSDSVPVFLVAGQTALMQHYGASVIDASNVAPRELGDFLREHSHGTREIRLVMNEYRGFRWDHSPSPVNVLVSDYACVVDRHLAYMDVILCRLRSPRLFSGESPPAYAPSASGPIYAR
jgi:hypothetical protein